MCKAGGHCWSMWHLPARIHFVKVKHKRFKRQEWQTAIYHRVLHVKHKAPIIGQVTGVDKTKQLTEYLLKKLHKLETIGLMLRYISLVASVGKT